MQSGRLAIEPLEPYFSLKDRVYEALRKGILSMDLYASREEVRLDERQLAADLGVSRTPIREAIHQLEQEGFLRVVQRRGVFVVRKTKREILEMIVTWAALESMAARLITLHATDEEIGSLRKLFGTVQDSQEDADIDEYSDKNIRFHQQILQISNNSLLNQTADNLFAHVRAIRHAALGQNNRMERSIKEHLDIIKALELRETELAERLVREHTLGLAAHVEQHLDFLD